MSIESLLMRLSAQGPNRDSISVATSATSATPATSTPLQSIDIALDLPGANAENLQPLPKNNPVSGGDSHVYLALPPLTQDQVQSVSSWLFLIGESEPAAIAHVLNACETSEDARQHILTIVAHAAPSAIERPDERRRCSGCMHLVHSHCTAARRGEINAAPNYQPITDLLQRCQAFKERDSCRHVQKFDGGQVTYSNGRTTLCL